MRTAAFLLAMAGLAGSGICQEANRRPQIEADIGVVVFDQTLAFETSTSIGLGVGHGITNFLQLNLAFGFSPTQQTISTAVSKLETRVYVFKYGINFRFTTPKALVLRLKPYLTAGVGGELLDPKSATIDLGGGNLIQTDPDTDHKFMITIGIGSMIALTHNLGLKLDCKNDLYRLEKVLDDGIKTKSVLARDIFFGAGLVISF